jgi:hypothetical protein
VGEAKNLTWVSDFDLFIVVGYSEQTQGHNATMHYVNSNDHTKEEALQIEIKPTFIT